MASKMPRHKHTYEQVGNDQVSGPDRKGKVTVVRTWQCTVRLPSRCTKTRTTKTKNNYIPITGRER